MVANEAALEKGVRYLEVDLNRSFPGRRAGKYEERLAGVVLRRLKKYGEVVDLHTATCSTPLFAILTR